MSVGVKESVRECSGCGKIKPLIAFVTYRDRKKQIRRRGICKLCRDAQDKKKNENLRAWRKEYNKKTKSKRSLQAKARRAAAKAFVDAYKSRPCMDCGRSFPPVAMDLDHVRGSKSKGIANLVGGAYKLDLIKIELEKCDVICACCHRIRTATRGDNLGPRAYTRRPDVPRISLRNVRMITMRGKTHSIAEWERRLGLPKGVASYRLRHGYSPREAFAKRTYTIGSSPARRRKTRASEKLTVLT